MKLHIDIRSTFIHLKTYQYQLSRLSFKTFFKLVNYQPDNNIKN